MGTRATVQFSVRNTQTLNAIVGTAAQDANGGCETKNSRKLTFGEVHWSLGALVYAVNMPMARGAKVHKALRTVKGNHDLRFLLGLL